MAKRLFIIEFDDDDEYIVETLEELEQRESFHIVVADPVLLSWSTADGNMRRLKNGPSVSPRE